MKKLVSIVLPVFNGEKYIKYSIDSILNQTYDNIELIIVDDCSTDNTSSIICEYAKKDSRVHIIKNEVNLKLPASLNVGFASAKGEYFTWTSDDNIYKQDAIERMVSAIEQKDAVLVYSDEIIIDADGEEIKKKNKFDAEYLLAKNVVGASFLYTADAAKNAGEYDTDFFLAEDYEYWIRLSKEGRVYHIPTDLYYYRNHGKSLTAQRQADIKAQTMRVLKKHFYYLYSNSEKRRVRRELLYHMYRMQKEVDEKGIISQICNIDSSMKRYVFMHNTKKKITRFVGVNFPNLANAIESKIKAQ